MRAMLLWLCTFPAPGFDGPPTPAEQYRAILDDYQAARRAFAAKPEAEQEALRSQYPSPEDYYERLLALAEAHPRDPAAVDALVWIAATSTNGFDDFKARGPRIRRAMEILEADHRDDPRVGRLCLALVAGAAPLRDRFLRAIYERSTDRRVKGAAALALGEFLLAKSATVLQLKQASGDLIRQVEAQSHHRLPYYREIVREDPEALARRGEQLLEEALDRYGDLPYDPALAPAGDKTLADVARVDIRRHRSLAVGQPAPEIEGEDADGRRFKLSDYRGSVVLLTFSGNWCGPCRALYPQERALVARLAGRPFAALSVNTDAKRETLRASIAEGEITWRCWWEPGAEGPTSTRWMVEGFPQVYLLDHKGVIRAHQFGDRSAQDRAVDDLVRAAEAEGRPPKD